MRCHFRRDLIDAAIIYAVDNFFDYDSDAERNELIKNFGKLYYSVFVSHEIGAHALTKGYHTCASSECIMQHYQPVETTWSQTNLSIRNNFDCWNVAGHKNDIYTQLKIIN